MSTKNIMVALTAAVLLFGIARISTNYDTVFAQESSEAKIPKGSKANLTEGSEAKAEESSIYMLNVLWFKKDGGAEKYQRYIEAATPFVLKYGGKALDAYSPEVAIIGKFDADLLFLVEWPNEKAFLSLIQDPEYQKISHLREEAIRDSLLIRCKKL